MIFSSQFSHDINLFKPFIDVEAVSFPGLEKVAYVGFKDGFQAAQKAITSFIYNRCCTSISSPLVASVNAELASVFDQSFKSMKWLRFVYGSSIKRNQFSFYLTKSLQYDDA